MNKKIQAIKTIIRSYFKNAKKEPYEATDGQCQIFMAITDPQYKYVWLSAPTRYGKSEIVALAVIYLAVFHNLKIPIVAGSADKANIIMQYVVQHLGDHEDLYKGLLNVQDFNNLERLKVQVSKSALRWVDGGWIYITSIDMKSIVKEGEGVVGEGGDVVLLEEAGLIRREEQFSKIVRMSEEDRGWGKLIMSGNCIENSVFENAYSNPLYYKVRIGLEQAVAEGRFTQQSLDAKKSQTTSKDWKRYYLVVFPAHNEFTYFKPKRYEIVPNDLKYYAALDPSLGESEKSSLIGIAVVAVDDKGQLYEVYTSGRTDGLEEAINEIFNLPFKFERFGVESVQFQKYLLHVLEEKSKALGKYIPFVPIQQRTNKRERIESLEPYINTGQILFQGNNLLWEHMQDYPEIEKLDILDALEMACRPLFGKKVEFEFI